MFHVVIYTSYIKIRETLQKQKQTEIGRSINHVVRIPAYRYDRFLRWTSIQCFFIRNEKS